MGLTPTAEWLGCEIDVALETALETALKRALEKALERAAHPQIGAGAAARSRFLWQTIQ